MQTLARDFFLRSTGATLEVLAFLSASKAQKLLNCLSKKAQSFLDRKRQDLAVMCAPGIFGAQMVQLPSVKHVD